MRRRARSRRRSFEGLSLSTTARPFVTEIEIGDGFVDFDRALRDPSDPSRLAPEYDSGDAVHPSSAGYRWMAEEVDLSALEGPECATR